jgi:hypothetical protein
MSAGFQEYALPEPSVARESTGSCASDKRSHKSGLSAGYAHPAYAKSLSGFGEPYELPASGGWLLRRGIPDSTNFDAMGCYPLFCCQNWSRLADDLRDFHGNLVSVSLVADPFGDCDEALLRRTFDHVRPFKTHFVVDLQKPLASYSSARHRKFARRAQRSLAIEVCANPLSQLDNWCALYDQLIQRHEIRGLRAFSREAFAGQLAVPGMVMFRADCGGETVGLDLWYVQGEVAQGHLAATSPRGYELGAAYGLKLAVIEHFKDQVRWLNLGGAAGMDKNANDGLTAFKRGWASDTRTAWFCGRILQPERYQELLRAPDRPVPDYFPAYRAGEFA